MKIYHYDGNELVIGENWIIDFDTHYVENFKTGFCDSFIYYGRPDTPTSSCVAYNFPESVPKYVRKVIKSVCLRKSKYCNNLRQIVYYRTPKL